MSEATRDQERAPPMGGTAGLRAGLLPWQGGHCGCCGASLMSQI